MTTRRMIIDHVNIHVRDLAEARQLYRASAEAQQLYRAAKDGDR